MADILRAAQHDEYSEYESVYPSFAKAAVEEGFPKAAASFTDIAKITDRAASTSDNLFILHSFSPQSAAEQIAESIIVSFKIIFPSKAPYIL